MSDDTRHSHGRTTLYREFLRDAVGRGLRPPGSPRDHLDVAMEWIATAQDVGNDRGVSRQFHLQHGWRPSYPETTGYIIETALDYAALAEEPAWGDRATTMARWLLDHRLEDGSIYGGDTAVKVRAPAIFNTGMVLHGWLRILEQDADPDILGATERALDFLVESMDEDGCWRRNLSRLTHGSIHTYNTRVAWALASAGRTHGRKDWSEAAVRNVSWAMRQRNDVGWFDHNDLTDDTRPLTHTIAYALRGILETALIAERQDWVDAVRESSDRVLEQQRPDGSVPGRLRADWTPAVDWVCLTGVVQLSAIWLKLAAHTGESRYREAAVRANRYVMSTQRLDDPNPGIRGGVKGSFPVWGGYITRAYPNWAPKFLADALMLEITLS